MDHVIRGRQVQPTTAGLNRDDEHRWCFFFSSRRRHTRCSRDWSSDVCSSDLLAEHLGKPVNLDLELSREQYEDMIAPFIEEIGRASVGKECRSRWSPYH